MSRAFNQPVRPRDLLIILLGLLILSSPAAAQPPARPLPSEAEVAELLQREPITLANWPTWRQRLLDWIGEKGHATDAAYAAARDFAREQAGKEGTLPAPLEKDAFAWYCLGNAYLWDFEQKDLHAAARQGEKAMRRSIQLDPNFARAHRNLGYALLLQEGQSRLLGGLEAQTLGELVQKARRGNPGDPKVPGSPNGPNIREQARRELDEARRLEPGLPTAWVEATAAVRLQRFAEAEKLFAQAMREEPAERSHAQMEAFAITANPNRPGKRTPAVQAVLDKFPDDGALVCFHGLALAMDGDAKSGYRELERARSLGTDPEKILGPQTVQQIEQHGAPGPMERSAVTLAWILGGFAAIYAVIMLFMAGAGVLLAGQTRGDRALDLLGGTPDTLVQEGQVVRAPSESALARLYAASLFVGLILFYIAIPFIVVGLIAMTAALLYLIFLLPRIPIKLILLIVLVGGGGAFSVVKSLFTRAGRGSFGMLKTAEEAPRLHAVVAEVAKRVDTDPVHEIYVAPGSAIGVHQEGRGPFGVFGIKRRVLTLGLSTMHYLTISELKAILAHEYAHFSHRDTFYSRFIYAVTGSITQALQGMGSTGGRLNYVNPFFWFLYLYYKAYSLLAAGYSRSREFLADRMASSLYGADIFGSALTKVTTDGTLFEMTVYQNISKLLEEDKAFVNMYDAFRQYRDQEMNKQEREELYQKLLDEKGSLFASHPTFGERMQAISALPKAEQTDSTPALQLFEDAEGIEKELTEFLTGYMHYVQRMQRQAAEG